MSNMTQRSIITAGLESVYGQAVDPANLKGILASIPDWKPVPEKIERDFARHTVSQVGSTIGMKWQTISFSTELKGANDNAEPTKEPNWVPLMQACWMKKELLVGGGVGGIDVLDLRPSSVAADKKSVTIYWYADTILHQMIGCRGSFSIKYPVGQPAKLKFDMTGLWSTPTDVVLPTNILFEEHNPPSCIDAGLTIDGRAPACLQNVSIDLGNQVSASKCMNATTGLKEINIGGRNPSGSIDPDVEALTEFNPFSTWENSEKIEVVFKIGSVAENREWTVIPAAQIGELGYQDVEGKRAYQLPLEPTGIDDEIQIQVG